MKRPRIVNVLLNLKYETCDKKICYITKTEKRVKASGFFVKEMRSGSSHKIRTGMGQLWPKKKQSGVST